MYACAIGIFGSFLAPSGAWSLPVDSLSRSADIGAARQQGAAFRGIIVKSGLSGAVRRRVSISDLGGPEIVALRRAGGWGVEECATSDEFDVARIASCFNFDPVRVV